MKSPKRIVGSYLSGDSWELCFPEDEPALERMGFFARDQQKQNQNRLEWYINVSQRRLVGLSQGEWLILKEEVLALHRTLTHKFSVEAPSESQIRTLRKFIYGHLERLASELDVSIGPFKVTYEIEVKPSTKAISTELQEFLGPKSSSPRWIQSRPVIQHEGIFDLCLHEHFGRLLMEFAQDIRRCPDPQCMRIFVKPRKNAEYCSSKCQSRHYMEIKRNTPADRIGKRGRPSKAASKVQNQNAKSAPIGGTKHGMTRQSRSSRNH